MALVLVLTLLLAFLCVAQSAPQNDTHALTQFRLQTDTHGYLLGNWTTGDACTAAWRGVECSPNGRVVGLSIPSLNLRGPIDSLSPLSYLRLELLYLAGNDFSGEIPPEIASLRLLLRLDLSDNNIRGPIPNELLKLTHLLTLRLQNNAFSGQVPDLSSSLLNLSELNITNNELHGHLPDAMFKKFGNASFSGNDGLCGPTPLPKKGLNPGTIVAIVVAVSVALVVAISFAVAHCCARGGSSNSTVGSESGKRKSESSYGSEKKGYCATGGVDRDSDGTCTETERSKLVFFDRKRNRGPGRIPLDWTTRISLVLGAARGLARIHAEYNAAKIPHGNVKSSNVLLDKNGVACISDFGLSLLLNPVHAIARLGGYRAPEQAEVKKLSQEADVYSFGVLLLEVLTGRAPSLYPSPARPRVELEEQEVDLPKWVRSVVKEEWTSEVFDQELLRYKNIEEELVSMLNVGLACVVPQPEKRPNMLEVVKMIEDIRVEQSPLRGEDYDESRNSLSPSLATTEDGLA
ncbi:Protein kinase domain [Sesbania bispinosa]|nr:Protein kinase domain [Sesbania bispinosa]